MRGPWTRRHVGARGRGGIDLGNLPGLSQGCVGCIVAFRRYCNGIPHTSKERRKDQEGGTQTRETRSSNQGGAARPRRRRSNQERSPQTKDAGRSNWTSGAHVVEARLKSSKRHPRHGGDAQIKQTVPTPWRRRPIKEGVPTSWRRRANQVDTPAPWSRCSNQAMAPTAWGDAPTNQVAPTPGRRERANQGTGAQAGAAAPEPGNRRPRRGGSAQAMEAVPKPWKQCPSHGSSAHAEEAVPKPRKQRPRQAPKPRKQRPRRGSSAHGTMRHPHHTGGTRAATDHSPKPSTIPGSANHNPTQANAPRNVPAQTEPAEPVNGAAETPHRQDDHPRTQRTLATKHTRRRIPSRPHSTSH